MYGCLLGGGRGLLGCVDTALWQVTFPHACNIFGNAIFNKETSTSVGTSTVLSRFGPMWLFYVLGTKNLLQWGSILIRETDKYSDRIDCSTGKCFQALQGRLNKHVKSEG
jgi:hypothetical protein